jgi:hypothetical protein
MVFFILESQMIKVTYGQPQRVQGAFQWLIVDFTLEDFSLFT